VDAEDERDALDRDRSDGGKRRREHDEGGAGATPATPFEASNSTADSPSCCFKPSGVFAACARKTALVAR
jgi:hypothetical protein